jgi:hypothetical protein
VAIAGLLGFGGVGMTCGRAPDGPGSTGADVPPTETPASPRVELDVFAFGRQLGQIAPCGCTTDPLGGLAFAFGYVDGASTTSTRLVLQPGSFLFPELGDPEAPEDEAGWAQADERAALLTKAFARYGKSFVVGVGPSDVTSPAGAAALTKHALPRVLTNAASDDAGFAREQIVEFDTEHARGLRAIVYEVVDPAMTENVAGFPALVPPGEAIAARAKTADEGALVIAVVHGPRTLAEAIARDVPALDLVVAAGRLEGAERSRSGGAPSLVGNAWVVEPGDRAQSIAHLTLSFDAPAAGKPPAVPAAKDWTLVPTKAQRSAELERLETRLKKFEADSAADPAFLQKLRDERDELSKSIEAGETAPASGTTAIIEQVKVTCRLPADAEVATALKGYDGWVSSENERRFKGVFTPEPKRGEARYVGIDACGDCHAEAVEQWKGTRHHQAYDTLVTGNKQFDLSCVGCHVTGFRKPSGAEVVETRGLVDVQCEQCHGPGSLHVEDPSPLNVVAKPDQRTCLECHTPEHSDTFSYEAYLRDVLGEGHGASARKALGDGPTGRELRAAGLEKAGGACPKM